LEDNLVLVDIGNTNYHFYKDGKILHTKKPQTIDEEVYYISVNKQKEKDFLSLNPKAINLKPFLKINTNYKNLGVDRAACIVAIQNGCIIDAGSAITIDIVKNSKHYGGVIMPGLYYFKESFRKISPVLDLGFNKLNELPNDTQSAITYGSIGAIKAVIDKLKGDLDLIITGGDGKFLQRYLGGEYVEDLIFRGMKEIIKGLK
jgi:type III pantothenate kinase